MLFKLDRYPHLNENRELSPLPVFRLRLAEIVGFPDAFQAYFDDHFGFRNALIRFNYLIKQKILGVSPSAQVSIGKQGWLYYTAEGAVEDYRGISYLDEDKLRKLCFTFELKRKWLELQGIKYLLVIAPNKETIYPEYLPSQLYRRIREKTVLDDFLEYLKRHSNVDIVDLRNPLREAKKEGLLFHKTDTHWNNYGAFVGYAKIMEPVSKWFKQVRVLSLNDFKVTTQTRPAGDLADMIGGTEFLEESEFDFKPIKPFSSYMVDWNNYKDFAMQKQDASLPRALIFRDSFAVALQPFLNENFQYVKYYWRRWDPEVSIHAIIREIKPDIVIEEVVERGVKSLPEFGFVHASSSSELYKDLFDASHKSLKIVGSDSEISGIQFNDQVSLVKSSGGLLIKSSGYDPQIYFSEIKTASKGYPVIKINIDSSSETVFQLFYLTAALTEYNEKSCVTVNLKKGNNEIYIPLYNRELIKKFRIDPSTCTGEFLLKAVEIRYWD
jgi:hypothetical protein